METKLINSQLSNFKTYEMYKRQFLTLAENVFEFEGLPEFIDISFLNSTLVRKGSIAFFKDENISDDLIVLPYSSINAKDVYGRPTSITVEGQNGYTRTLKKDEFVLMYDNNGRYPIFIDILQYAERIAHCVRVMDINIRSTKDSKILENII